ncbi:MAG: signal peptidase I [Oscillospiraceae bacterium]|jgi:signal peptidase I|nr:signal peptidase I [Oscillospiraceae bacterium]
MKQSSVRAEARQNRVLNVFLVFLPLLLAVVIIPAFLGNRTPAYKNTFYGIRLYVIQSDSMEPTIAVGALVFGKAEDFSKIKEGDIITFEFAADAQVSLNTHRVVEQDGAFLRTKGDNVTIVDPEPVTQSNYRYKVISIWNWTAKLGTFDGVMLYVVLPLVLLGLLTAAVIVLVILLKKIRKRNTEAAMQIPAAQPAPIEPIAKIVEGEAVERTTDFAIKPIQTDEIPKEEDRLSTEPAVQVSAAQPMPIEPIAEIIEEEPTEKAVEAPAEGVVQEVTETVERVTDFAVKPIQADEINPQHDEEDMLMDAITHSLSSGNTRTENENDIVDDLLLLLDEIV